MHKRLRVNRLLRLAAHLRTVPYEKFEMGTWGEAWKPVHGPTCVTSACALGWATSIPEFRRAGLKLMAAQGSMHADVYYRDVQNFDAAGEFFNLVFLGQHQLFAGGASTPKEKADEIEVFVEEYNRVRKEGKGERKAQEAAARYCQEHY